MKIPLLILCLAVVYGTCRTYNEEDDVAKAIQNNGNYENYVNMPFEKSLARYKRTILSPVMSTTYPIDALSSLLGFNGVRSTDGNFMTFVIGLLTGKDCPKDLSLGYIISNISLNPFKTIQIVACYLMQTFSATGNAVLQQIFTVMKDFSLKLGLPILHTLLNKIKDNPLLPEQLNNMIVAFNGIYSILQLLGYIPKN